MQMAVIKMIIRHLNMIEDIYIYLYTCIYGYSSWLIMVIILEHSGLDPSKDDLQPTNMHIARSSLGARELRRVETRELG